MKFKKGKIPWNKGKRNPYSREILERMSTSHLGKKDSLETRIKKSVSGKNKTFSDEHKKNISKSKRGFKFTEESREKMSLAQRGPKSWKWRGGISVENEGERKLPEYRYWRRQCLKRDNFTCQKTGQKGGRLVVHHINNFADFPELRFVIENGITLSEEEHINFHSIYGNKNNTREQLDEFLKTSDKLK